MKRIELFELEDFQWMPSIFRNLATNVIIVFHKIMGSADMIADLILRIKEKSDFSEITDLGSGSGGPMLDVVDKLNEESSHKIKITLSDFFPNPKIVNQINGLNHPQLTYHGESIDATNNKHATKGLKTMIASFHHMNPTKAKMILHSAQENKQPILIYELAKNTIPTLVWWLFLPLSLVITFIMALVLTPFVRPFTFPQFLFTYLIPIVPIIYAWDGQASMIRTYTFEDVEELLSDFRNDDYHWEIGDAKNEKGKGQGYYIMGIPKGN